MTRTIIACLSFICMTAVACAPAFSQETTVPELTVFENGLRSLQMTDLERGKMLKEIGYAGIDYSGCQNAKERLAAMDEAGLKVNSIYVGSTVSPDGYTYDELLPEAIKTYAGRDVEIWLFIRKGPGATAWNDTCDKQAIALLNDVADMAKKAELKVAIYPHAGFYVERTDHAVAIAKEVDRENVGMLFNICHWLKSQDDAPLEQRLEEAMPVLFGVNVNGADVDGTNWSQLIQPLDSGTFDTKAMLETLDELGYKGPFGQQCYAVPGDQKENLERSMKAWRGFFGE